MKKCILIIEDDPDIMSVYRTILEENDFVVEGIDAFDNTIETITRYKPDLVLTDYLLSGTNGGKICQQIKSNKDTYHIPVVLITAYGDLAKALGSFGFDAFIEKPFQIDELLGTIRKLLKIS
ncbi:MAG TPA: response regulator [Mucilaginibacter sp.]